MVGFGPRAGRPPDSRWSRRRRRRLERLSCPVVALIENVLWAVRYQPVAAMASTSVAIAAVGSAASALGRRSLSEPLLRAAWFAPTVASISAASSAVLSNLLESVLSPELADLVPLLGVLLGAASWCGIVFVHVLRGIRATAAENPGPFDRPLALTSVAVLLVAALLWPGGFLDLGRAPKPIAGQIDMSTKSRRDAPPPEKRKEILEGQEKIIRELQARRAGGAATEGGDITALIWSSGAEPGKALRRELASWVDDGELSKLNRSAAALALAQSGERGHRSTVRRLARTAEPKETEAFRRLIAALVRLDEEAALRFLRRDVGLEAPQPDRARLPEWEARAHLLAMGTADASDTVAQLLEAQHDAGWVIDLPAAARTGGLRPGELLDRLMISMTESDSGGERVVACQVLSVWRPPPTLDPPLDCAQWTRADFAESQRSGWPAIRPVAP